MDSVQSDDADNDRRHRLYVGGLSFLGMCTIIMVIIICNFVWKTVRKFGLGVFFGNKLMVFTVITMVLELAYVVMDWSRTFILASEDINWDHSNEYLVLINNVVYYFGTMCFYISLVVRVHVLFKSTLDVYLSKSEVTALATILIFDIAAIVFFLLCIYENFSQQSIPWIGTNLEEARVIGSSVTIMFNDILINGVILWIVFRKFYIPLYELDEKYQTLVDRLSVLQEKDENLSDCSVQSDLRNTRTKQQDIMDLLTKLAVLAIVSVIFAQFYSIVVMYLNIIQAQNGDYSEMYFNYCIMIVYSFRAVEAVCDCVVLLLTYKHNENYYYAMCDTFHQCLKNYCIKCIAGKNAQMRMKNNAINNFIPNHRQTIGTATIDTHTSMRGANTGPENLIGVENNGGDKYRANNNDEAILLVESPSAATKKESLN